ncbi:uncharacterized protein LOC119741414 [Patiria miniata]|uniref:WAP domain-containing protein n=1 Tax=Patiria miniata TaxID=46514 RepID=A0A914BB67_PATMI|nr:uncharacterized protein LOC119741414 [Patiria miniata]
MELKIPFCLIFMLTGGAAEWKPGQCPISDGGQLGICVQECAVDFDCYGNQKCCKNGCGMTCRYPENIGVPHAGLCPAVNSSEPAMCIDPPPCDIDQDCVSHEKCCFTGCSFMCVASERREENRLGMCPAEVPSILRQTRQDPVKTNCTVRCADDRDCDVDRKCCNDAVCGRTCTEPVYACYHNGRIYQNHENIVESDGCSSCSCLDGFLACKQIYCGKITSVAIQQPLCVHVHKIPEAHQNEDCKLIQQTIQQSNMCSIVQSLCSWLSFSILIIDPALDKIRILTICLIALGGVCLVGSILSFLKYQHSKRSCSIRNKGKNQAVNMMSHEMEFLDPIPTKV